MKKTMTTLFAAISALPLFALSLDEGFRAPPLEAKPMTWYHMMNGNVTKEGITRDFEAMAEAGIGGMQIFAVGCAIPEGKVSFDSPEWHDILLHAHKEAKRLGLQMCILNCAGWSNSGGPWLKAEDAMKATRFTETHVKGPGPSRFSGFLPREKNDNGFYEDIAVLAYPTPATGPALSKLGSKIGLESVSWAGSNDFLPRDAQPRNANQIVAKDKIVDLTSKMAKDGRLEWDVPKGDWTILRIGYICNGRRNHPAPKGGMGFEVDKLSAGAMDRFFDGYVGRVASELGVKPGEPAETGFNGVLIDSYEVGSQNWTQGLDKTFEKRMGYSIIPYMPVFAGYVVGSADESERVLEDFRRLLADLFAENYAGRFAKRCRERGLLSYIEPYYGVNSDDLQYGQDAEIPMAEFWSKASQGDHAGDTGNSRFAASLAHVWGRRYAATESFTAGPPSGGRWLTTPFSIKNQGDRAFADGVNRIVFHTYTHQPWTNATRLPGMTMGRWGIHLVRTQTWWPYASAFFRYQARCQWMLQEGTFVADALIWSGEAAPNRNGRGNPDIGLPKGFDRDVCATKAVEMLKVRNGKIVAPGGVEYEILVLPNTDTMSERVLCRLGELADAGAKIVAPRRPSRAPGMTGVTPILTSRATPYKSLVDFVWSKGIMECTTAEALSHLGITPDFTSDAQDAVFIHRRDNSADWYFVARNNETPSSFEASFRISGRKPEIWDAVTGEIRPAPVWFERNGRTYVKLDFKPSGSAFVVFRDGASTSQRHVVKATVSVMPQEQAPAPAHTYSLKIKKAVYGVFPDLVPPASVKLIKKDWYEDITAKIAANIKPDGSVAVTLDNDFAGRIFAYGFIKTTRIEYELDGQSFTADIPEHCMFKIGEDEPQPPPSWEWRDGRIVAWRPFTAELKCSDGTTSHVSAKPAMAIDVKGAWNVSFPAGWEAPASVEFPELKSWTAFDDPGIKYFSGTATYRKRVALGTGKGEPGTRERIMLDLGNVKNFAEVTVNGKTFPVLWQPPYRLDVTDAVTGAADSLDLEVKVTNLWPNRLIGDDTLRAPDCEWSCNPKRHNTTEWGIKEIPAWVWDGKKSPTGRLTFTTWRHWTKHDAPFSSGLIGPVKIWFGETAK